MSKRVKQIYTPEFRAEAIKLVLEQGLTVAEAATKLNMNQGTLAYWIKQARQGKAADASTAGQPSVESLLTEVRRLNKELADTRMERDILKKATASPKGISCGATLPGSHCPVRVRKTMAISLSHQAVMSGCGSFSLRILCLVETPTLPPNP